LTFAQLHHVPDDELDDKLSDTKRIENYVMSASVISDSILNIFSNPSINIQPFIRKCILYAAI
jgi:hypothetical protein